MAGPPGPRLAAEGMPEGKLGITILHSLDHISLILAGMVLTTLGLRLPPHTHSQSQRTHEHRVGLRGHGRWLCKVNQMMRLHPEAAIVIGAFKNHKGFAGASKFSFL